MYLATPLTFIKATWKRKKWHLFVFCVTIRWHAVSSIEEVDYAGVRYCRHACKCCDIEQLVAECLKCCAKRKLLPLCTRE